MPARRARLPRSLRYALIALAVTATAVAALLWLAQDQEVLQLRSAHAADEPSSAEYLAALSSASTSRGNTFEILQNGDEVFPAMLEAIARADHRVSFETYVFEDGIVAREFVTALERAARRGLVVNIILDSFGGDGVTREQFDRLGAAGCHVSRYNAATPGGLEEVNYRTHRKILVIDGVEAFIGGVGVADHWLGDAQDAEHWRDTQVRLRGPVARDVEAAFYENFTEGSGPVTPLLNLTARAHAESDPTTSGHSTPGTPSQQAPTLVVRSAASGGTSDLKLLYLLLIASARHTLDIATPYFVNDPSVMWTLHDAVQRGVRVRVLMEGDITDAPPVKHASRRSYDQLLEWGIELYEYQPTMMHTKIMIVDDVWSMFGSANFDNRSLELNDELNVAVQDAELAKRFRETFDADLARAERIELARWRQRPLAGKVREFFWGYWGEIF